MKLITQLALLILIVLKINGQDITKRNIQYNLAFSYGHHTNYHKVIEDDGGYLLSSPNKYDQHSNNAHDKIYTGSIEARLPSNWIIGLHYSEYFHETHLDTYIDLKDQHYSRFEYIESNGSMYDVKHTHFSLGHRFGRHGGLFSLTPSAGMGYARLKYGHEIPSRTNISFSNNGQSFEPWYGESRFKSAHNHNYFIHLAIEIDAPIYKGLSVFGKVQFVQGLFQEYKHTVYYEEPLRPINGQYQFNGEIRTRGSFSGWMGGIKMNLNWAFPKLNGQPRKRSQRRIDRRQKRKDRKYKN